MNDPQAVARLRNCRRSLTSVLLTLPINTHEMHVDTLVSLLDHFSNYPDQYIELAHGRTEDCEHS